MFFDKKPAAPQEDLANLKITDARVKDTLSVTGAAEDFSDLDFTVDRRDLYEAGSNRWTVLSGTWRDRRVFLEVHNEDTIEVLGNFDGRKITLDELGLSEDDMGELDARQNPADFLDFEGKFWLYRFSREMGVFSEGNATGRGFYGWEFHEQDGKRYLSVRKFEGEPFTASIWVKVEPTDITVFQRGIIMSACKRYVAIAGALLLVSCGGLPRALRNQIASEKAALQTTERQLQHSLQTVKDDIAHSPDLFRGTSVSTEWPARLQSARATLDRAKNDLQQFDRLNDPRRAEQLLSEERALRQSVVRDAESVEADANSWLDFERNIPHYLTAMQREYDQIHAVDLTPVTAAVQKAEQDWPAKKADLEGRLATLKQSSADAAGTEWRATESARQDAAAGTAKGPEIATLIQASDVLRRDDSQLTHDAEVLRAECGQLYDLWDKILADLEVAHREGETVYSEKLSTVRTHYVDVAAKKTEVSSDNKWVDVPASSYRAVENDLGMVIAHKDAGLFDSEAQNKVQPPGFAYIAPPSQGSNQYGYWSHSGGESVWTFLPQYLLMRELLWGHSYRPIYINEFNGYQTAMRAGRTYYGQETPSSAPKYGSHGTFTQQRYSGSRYVQSGGYGGSAYATNRSAAPSPRPESSFSPRGEDSSAGKRFGGSSSGQKFGGSNSGGGQRFGSPAIPRVPGRSFGRRR